MSDLSSKKCVPCEGGTKPLTASQYAPYLESIEGWTVSENKKLLTKTITAKNFISVVKLIDKIAEIAEAEGHHPDLNLHDYKQLTITLSTHAINGLSINDFILAAKIDMVQDES